MNKSEAIRNEPDQRLKRILKKYDNADIYVIVNDGDKHLKPIRIPLPECPDWKKIDGYGMVPEDQIFRIQEYPNRLDILVDRVRDEIKERDREKKTKPSLRSIELDIQHGIWEILKNESLKYKNEISFIRRQWSYRLYGYWFFNNGKPTYIDGWHFFYLNYWSLEGVGNPKYWDRDRRWFIFQRFCFTDTTVPVLNKDGIPIISSDGFYKLKDIGSRVCFGSNVNKGRRVGDTSKAECINFCFLSSERQINTGIQGDSGETAEKAFIEKLVNGYRSQSLKFFFRPIFTSINPKNEILFDDETGINGLGSRGDYASTAHRQFYDSRKLRFIHQDEIGKTKDEDIDKRQSVLKRCCQLGSKIIGLMIGTSTVEDVTHDAIKKFIKLTEKSHYHDRDINGRTSSGLYNLFIPSYDGYEGFIDQYGKSIIDSPMPYQIPYMDTVMRNKDGDIMGAKEFLENERRSLLDRDDIEGHSEHKRLHPFRFIDCFTPPARNQLFNTHILESRYNELKFDGADKHVRSGNFIWTAGFGSHVAFVDDDDDGRFRVSKLLEPSNANRYYSNNNVKYPEYPDKYISSADAFRYEKTDGGKMSNGGGATRWKRDLSIDDDEKDVKDWVTARFVCTYNFRPNTKDEFCEDMLKMCVYYGSMMYPEMNVPEVADFFNKHGYGGFLLYDMDAKTGQIKNNPGFHTTGQSKINIFSYMKSEVYTNGHRWEFVELIEECLKIKNPGDMTNYDLFTAASGCLMGEQSEYAKAMSSYQYSDYDVTDLYSVK